MDLLVQLSNFKAVRRNSIDKQYSTVVTRFQLKIVNSSGRKLPAFSRSTMHACRFWIMRYYTLFITALPRAQSIHLNQTEATPSLRHRKEIPQNCLLYAKQWREYEAAVHPLWENYLSTWRWKQCLASDQNRSIKRKKNTRKMPLKLLPENPKIVVAF